jgi:hypothetical protein
LIHGRPRASAKAALRFITAQAARQQTGEQDTQTWRDYPIPNLLASCAGDIFPGSVFANRVRVPLELAHVELLGIRRRRDAIQTELQRISSDSLALSKNHKPTTEGNPVTSKNRRLFAEARIAVGRARSATAIPVILGGDTEEVPATRVEIGDRIRISGRTHRDDSAREDSKTASIFFESVQQIGKRGAA